ncbi:MAG: SDR family NAD(P)-dependent oxidoreductase [Puniceicoccaceae bacterium]
MKTLLITGANRGIGLALTRALLENGHSVMGTYRDAARSQTLLDLAAESNRLHALQADVTHAGDHTRLAEQIDSLGGLDWVIHNAGVAAWGPLETESEERLLDTFRTNVVAPLLLTRALLPLLRRSQDAKVWMISSKMGSITEAKRIPGPNYAYPISKAALNMAGVQLARELAPFKIPVFLQTPGWVRTDMGGESADLSVQQCASALLKQFHSLSFADSGCFQEFDGSPLPF